MEKQRIKRLPVLDKGRLVGIFSRADIMRAFVTLKPTKIDTPLSDAELSRRTKVELDAQPWSPQSVLLQVHEGVVEIAGVITDDRTRDALRVLAQNIAGVDRVVDHLVTIERMSGLVITMPPDLEKRKVS
jgi:CBS domain-containing protein